MTGQQLADLTHAIGYFTIDELPGLILSDKQAWIFEGGSPRPITRSEILKRGGTDDTSDEVAELLSAQPKAIDFLNRVSTSIPKKKEKK